MRREGSSAVLAEVIHDPIGQRPRVKDHIAAAQPGRYIPEHHPLIVQRLNHEHASTKIQAMFNGRAVRNVIRVLQRTTALGAATISEEAPSPAPPRPKKGLRPEEEVALARKKARDARGRVQPKPTIIQLRGTPDQQHQQLMALAPEHRAACLAQMSAQVAP